MIDISTVYADVCRWEGCEPHLYRDDKGLVTTGPGFRVANVSAALALPWQTPNGSLATEDQVSEQYAALEGSPTGRVAAFYVAFTTMRIGADDCLRIAGDRLRNEFLPSLHRHFPHFDDYPEAAQRVLVDIIWNVGVGGILRFHKLVIACEEGDWTAAAREAHTVEIRDDGSVSEHAVARNLWRASVIRDELTS